MQMGDELQDELANTTGPVHCKQLVDDKICEILVELSRYETAE
jgi:hypothetical protein